MKTLIIIVMCVLMLPLYGCRTRVTTIRAVNPETKVEMYQVCQPEDLIYADVESKGTGYIKKTVKWDPISGRVTEYTVEAAPMQGIVDTTKAGASIGASMAGTAAKVMGSEDK